jgi:hypothetical protein
MRCAFLTGAQFYSVKAAKPHKYKLSGRLAFMHLNACIGTKMQLFLAAFGSGLAADWTLSCVRACGEALIDARS